MNCWTAFLIRFYFSESNTLLVLVSEKPLSLSRREKTRGKVYWLKLSSYCACVHIFLPWMTERRYARLLVNGRKLCFSYVLALSLYVEWMQARKKKCMPCSSQPRHSSRILYIKHYGVALLVPNCHGVEFHRVSPVFSHQNESKLLSTLGRRIK